MPIDLNSFVWASMGIEPPTPEDAVYNAGDQPIAGFDNHAKWALTQDLHNLTTWVGAHSDVHEAGGSQEIDLDGLSVGTAGSLVDSAGNFAVESDTNTALTMDVDAGEVSEFPAFTVPSRHREGVLLGNDIERQDGDVIYDYTNNTFHHAEEADEADWAALAFDSDHLEDHTVQDILDLVEDGLIPEAMVDVADDGNRVVENAERLDFDQSIDVAKDGTTARMSVDSVPHAENADYADDSDKVDGYHAHDLINQMDDGRWSYIGDWDITGEDWSLNISLDPEDVYDRYRMTVYHEGPRPDQVPRGVGHKGLFIRVNGDGRERYGAVHRRSEHDVGLPSRTGRVMYHETRKRTNWEFAKVAVGKRSISEWEIACPQPMTNEVEHTPVLSEISRGGPYHMSGTTVWGELETNYTQVDEFLIYPRHGPANVRVKLWGAPFFD